jgi:glyoxylase-like metal-dependent hydrolase (beta-lactamase superfamily II)
MANLQQRLPENVRGDFFVDSTCIDCTPAVNLRRDLPRPWRAVQRFHHQPQSEDETKSALMALVACPTGSIGSTEKHDPHIGIDAFPLHISDDVYFCGFTSEASFGGWSYLIKRPTGNVLIDSPRFASQLAKRIEAMGGVAKMLLTHKDDIAAHESFRARFGTTRTMHRADGAARLQIEQVIDGEESIALDEDLLAIPTPGHTRGHVVFLYKQKFLFTGDHLAWSPVRETLTAFRSVAWYSWPEQIRSMEKLLAYEFEWVLPGHGDMHHDSAANMKSYLERCIAWMKTRN